MTKSELSPLTRHWQHFLLAVGFLTRIPLPHDPDFKPEKLDGAPAYFPLVGGLLGGLAGLLLLAFDALFEAPLLVVALTMAALVMLTGAFHEDGLADTADGLGGGWQREDVLRIMKDSRVGSFGVVALVMVLLVKVASLVAMSAVEAASAVVVGQLLSRWVAISFMVDLPYVSGDGKSKPLATALPLRHALMAGAPAILILPLLSAGQWLAILLGLVVLRCLFAGLLRRRLQGYTGDTLGAAQQLSEAWVYVLLLL